MNSAICQKIKMSENILTSCQNGDILSIVTRCQNTTRGQGNAEGITGAYSFKKRRDRQCL